MPRIVNETKGTVAAEQEAHGAPELPAGGAAKAGVEAGDRLALEASTKETTGGS